MTVVSDTRILSEQEITGKDPREIRLLTRGGRFRGPNTQVADNFVLTTFVAFPRAVALEFMVYAQRNSAPIPVLEVLDPGSPIVRSLAPGADIRTDIPQYRVFREGKLVSSPFDLLNEWTDDLVGFLIGCSCSFERLLVSSGIRLRLIEEGQVGSIYLTNIPTEESGPFGGPLAVSMRSIHWTQVSRAVQLTSRFPAYHGAPIHVGDPSVIGIENLSKPWWGDVPTVRKDEVPVFWACSVTPQVAARRAGLSFVTNEPSRMFLTDTKMQTQAIFS